MYSQIVRENNKWLDKTIIYEYNDNGCITIVKTYAYTQDATLSGSYTEETFSYDSTDKEKLTGYGTSNISYDAYGYPTSYGNKLFAWERGKLKHVTVGADQYSYTYNAFGQRVAKEKNTAGEASGKTTYTYDNNGRLLMERIFTYTSGSISDTKDVIYLYDESGMIGMIYDGTYCYFHRNIRGDITELYSASGTVLAKYAYDAYGNCTVLGGTTDATLANANPIRYRGYYYDTETGFYFLNARYYNPQWRRFISPDSTAYIDPESVNGLNLYCYCNNDPVNYVDPSGHSWESFWNSTGGKILGTVLVVGAMVLLSIATAGVATAVVGVLGGGFLAAVVGGAVGGAISGAIFGAGISMVSQGISNGYSNIDYGQVGLEGLVGMASGALTGAIFAGIGRGLGLIGKTKWAQRILNNFDDVSKNYMFGSKSGNFTFLRNGRNFRLESSLQHGLHYHSLAAGTTAPQWELIFGISNLISGFIGGPVTDDTDKVPIFRTWHVKSIQKTWA